MTKSEAAEKEQKGSEEKRKEGKETKETKETKGSSGSVAAIIVLLVAILLAFVNQESIKELVNAKLGKRSEVAQAEEAAYASNYEMDEMEEEEEVIMEESVEESGMKATFVNNWGSSVTLWWEGSDDDWKTVVESFTGPIEMNTFVGHRFMYTREGTRDQIGESVTMEKGKSVYTLEAGTRRKAETEDPCTDRFPKRCPRYANEGECDINPGWMIVNCPRSCNACELLDPNKRCDRKFLNISEEHVWAPGDLDKMFERILEDFKDLEIEVASRPPAGPWILVFDKFLTDPEIDQFLHWGKKLGYERSSDVGETNERGETTKVISSSRTSSNTWCSSECELDPLVVSVSERIEKITRVPQKNYESFQLLEYQVGQYYREHHDMSPSGKTEANGPRILTFFLYLNDVEEGGETSFPKALDGIKVKPKKGRAVLWPSVLDDSPLEQDPRTLHAALPVIKGTKYASNHWIHSHDFKTVNKWGCSGSFS